MSDSIPFKRLDRLSQLLLLVALALLVPIITRALPTLYDLGKMPVKPRDYTLLMLGATFFLLVLSRPAFSFAAFGLLLVPFARVVDAAFLERFSVSFLGDHKTFVMNLLSSALVSLAGVALLASPHWRKIAVWVSVASILVVNGSVYYEAAGLIELTRIDGRAAGFPIDPNDPPITSCLLIGVVFTLHPHFWKNLALAAYCAPAISLTLSRSGLAVFIVVVGAYLLLNFRHHVTGLMLAGLACIPVAAAGVALLAHRADQGMVKDENTTGRMQAIYELDFEKLKSPERAKDLADGWEGVTDRPIWGHGTGSGTARWQPHNQIVAVWLDLGLGGMMFFVLPLLMTTLVCVVKGLEGLYCLIPVWLFIPCSQTLLDSPQYWFCYAVAVLVLFPKRYALRLGGLREALRQPPPPSPQTAHRA